MLTCEKVTKRYGSKNAVSELDLHLEGGKIYALLGPNGSGKSTLMKMIDGLTRPDDGEILFHGTKVGVESKKRIAYMPTEPFFYPYMTAADAGKYYEDFFEDFNRQEYEQLLQEMDLDLKQKISKMSTGMTAKLKIVLSLARNAELIMLDEPLNGIDVIARDQVLNIIRRHQDGTKAFVISSHLVEELEQMADYAIFIRKGQVIRQGEIRELIEQEKKSMADLYREIYGGGQAWEN